MTKVMSKKIVVLGDLQADCFQSVATVENKPLQVEVASEPGGAGLTARILDELARSGAKPWSVSMNPLGTPAGKRLDCTWHVVKEIPPPRKKGEKRKKDDPPPPWRIVDILGNSSVDAVGPLPGTTARLVGTDVLVVDDANQGLRSRPVDELKAGLKGLPTGCSVVYKMARPAAKGNLWEALAPWRSTTTAVIRVDDLRDAGVLISAGLSWEKTCEELAWELRFSKHMVGLWECAAVAVLFPFDAVFLMDRFEVENPETREKASKQRCRLVLDPSNAEGQWHSAIKGKVLGACTLLTAAVAQAVASTSDLAGACAAALDAMRAVEQAGYSRGDRAKEQPATFYPVDKACRALQASSENFAKMDVLVPWSDDYKEGWTFLERMKRKDLVRVASDVLRFGPRKTLTGVPVLTYENLSTADRSEIEGYQAVRNLLERYVKGDSKQPLSIAVFGPPGSGKSFGVKQIAKAIAADVVETKEFNLSQFRNPDELTVALHVARDICLSGKCPLIFWDEFDSAVDGKPLFWLKYFLAPMQDGEFREGGTNHPTGRAIYVFAGGTKKTFQEFSEIPAEDPKHPGRPQAVRDAKLPDFVSRLKGYINVMGPNQRLRADDGPDPTDRFHVVRRAVILRSQLERAAGHLIVNGELKIDEGLVNAFLMTRVFKHGARSMENIIAMSDLAGRSSFERSRLPSPAQLYIHVEEDFLNIAQQPVFSDEDVKSMALKSHECYRKAKFGKGQLDGASPEVRLKEGDVPLSTMPEDYQSSSRAFVRSIALRLVAEGCAVVPMRGVTPLPLPDSLIERMAAQEHDRWMAEKQASGFRLGYPKDNDAKVHPWLVAWDALAEDTKELDRVQLRGIPEILAVVGAGVRLQDGRMVQEVRGRGVVRPWRISVVGHRSVAETPELDLVVSGVMRELESLRPEGNSVEVVSCLAHGADRILAVVAMRELGANLKAVLPMPADVYEIDFSPESRQEFRRLLARATTTVLLAPAVRPASYRQGSEFAVDDADVLVGLWDGKPPRGPAGTAVAMVDAFAKKKRVVWIRSDDLKRMSDEEFQRTASSLKKKMDAAAKARKGATHRAS